MVFVVLVEMVMFEVNWSREGWNMEPGRNKEGGLGRIEYEVDWVMKDTHSTTDNNISEEDIAADPLQSG